MSSGATRTDSLTKVSSLAALQSSPFRWYFAGQLVSVSGTWMQAIAQQVVVYDLTKSELTLGLVACAQGIPSLFLSPFGGVIVEQFSRRKIIIVTQSVMMVLSMVIIAGLVGGGALGLEAVNGLARSQLGRGLEAGLAIVILAIVLDRITQAWAGGLTESNQPAR